MLTDTQLVEKIKKEKDSDAIIEVIQRHTGSYFNVVHRYVNAYPTIPQYTELVDDKMFNIYRFVMDYKPEKGMKLSSYIYDRTNYMCKSILTNEKSNPTNNPVQLGEPDGVTYDNNGILQDPSSVDVSDQSAQSQVIEQVESHSMTEDIFKAVSLWCSDKRAVKIIRYRHFNKQGKPKTWREIGKIFGISYERARQIYLENMEIVKKRVGQDSIVLPCKE